ncbi:hypothetical protein F383_30601 [Gossypium arboreum]|uniref:Uncharacterized protein n=1 Tax=Gossypium arboreum TaxID=29729 RepID=A0A0B0PL27_GOSAR|nr:hypothetical protein F383_30601 [Gossypium arboreum]
MLRIGHTGIDTVMFLSRVKYTAQHMDGLAYGRVAGHITQVRELHGYEHGLGHGRVPYIECPHGLPTCACDSYI